MANDWRNFTATFKGTKHMCIVNYSEKKGKSSESIACMKQIAASVLLKLFINGNESCHTNEAS